MQKLHAGVTYILMANEGFRLSANSGCPVGIAAAVKLFAVYTIITFGKKKEKV